MTSHRVFVSTDLGGDPDDIQSLYRLVHYSDVLDIEGISSCTGPGSEPSAELIRQWIRRIDVDHLRNQGHMELTPEADILPTVRQGPTDPRAPFEGGGTPGSNFLIERAQAVEDPDRPLWVLVWGSITGVAQALYDAPEIADRIRIYYIGSSNTENDPAARDWVYEFMKNDYPNLWWIENGAMPKWSGETFRGVYLGGVQRDDWGRQTFLETHIRGHGSTRNGEFNRVCGDAFPTASGTGNEHIDDGGPPDEVLKEGDSPSILYLLSPVIGGVGDLDDPTQPNWGGRFRLAEPDDHPHYYIDLDADLPTCWRTINRWRVDFLADWRDRWDRYDTSA